MQAGGVAGCVAWLEAVVIWGRRDRGYCVVHGRNAGEVRLDCCMGRWQFADARRGWPWVLLARLGETIAWLAFAWDGASNVLRALCASSLVPLACTGLGQACFCRAWQYVGPGNRWA